MLHKAWNSKGEMLYCFPRSSIKFQGHKVQNITDFDPNWAFPDYRPVAAFKSLRFALLVYNYDRISVNWRCPMTQVDTAPEPSRELWFGCDNTACWETAWNETYSAQQILYLQEDPSSCHPFLMI